MDLLRYQNEAQNTKSPQYYGDKIARNVFIQRMFAAIAALQKLDEIKKLMFYGKPVAGLAPEEFDATCMTLQLHNLHNTPEGGIDLLHAIIGKATEAGELLEAVMKATAEPGQPLDAVNIIEEIGDGFWYDAIALEALQATFADAAERNNRKLRTRFPNKFTERDAVRRNLDAEREQLERRGGGQQEHDCIMREITHSG